MAIAVIGGVITSTFLTLLVVPVVFAGIEKLPAFALGLFRRNKLAPGASDVEPTAAAEV
jgi:hypothetical protein